MQMTYAQLVLTLVEHLTVAVALLEDRDRQYNQSTPTSRKVITDARALAETAYSKVYRS